jgi:hypothetical protein
MQLTAEGRRDKRMAKLTDIFSYRFVANILKNETVKFMYIKFSLISYTVQYIKKRRDSQSLFVVVYARLCATRITLRIAYCSYRKSIAVLTITVNKGLATSLYTVHRVTFITASLKKTGNVRIM